MTFFGKKRFFKTFVVKFQVHSVPEVWRQRLESAIFPIERHIYYYHRNTKYFYATMWHVIGNRNFSRRWRQISSKHVPEILTSWEDSRKRHTHKAKVRDAGIEVVYSDSFLEDMCFIILGRIDISKNVNHWSFCFITSFGVVSSTSIQFSWRWDWGCWKGLQITPFFKVKHQTRSQHFLPLWY